MAYNLLKINQLQLQGALYLHISSEQDSLYSKSEQESMLFQVAPIKFENAPCDKAFRKSLWLMELVSLSTKSEKVAADVTLSRSGQ